MEDYILCLMADEEFKKYVDKFFLRDENQEKFLGQINNIAINPFDDKKTWTIMNQFHGKHKNGFMDVTNFVFIDVFTVAHITVFIFDFIGVFTLLLKGVFVGISKYAFYLPLRL